MVEQRTAKQRSETNENYVIIKLHLICVAFSICTLLFRLQEFRFD